jgi:dienelactone hydrolase
MRLPFTSLIPIAFTATASAQTIQINPASPILAGTPISISISGAPPSKEVKLIAERVIGGDEPNARALYRAEATFTTDAKGALDLAQAAAKTGTYKGVDPRGLFWSMLPTKEALPAGQELGVVRLRVVSEGAVIARGELTLQRALPEVKSEKVGAFPGAVFATLGGEKKRPAVILLGGSEGGDVVTSGAAPLASHGFAVLALPYYSPKDFRTGKQDVPGLPEAFVDIPIERLDVARKWLQARADVDASKIALHGTSKGAEFVLLAGVHLGWPSAIVAIVPSDVVWEGWGPDVEVGKRSSFALKGQPLPFTPYQDFGKEFTGFQTGEPIYIRRPQDLGRAANPAAAVAARIPVEKIAVPVMVVGGHDDQTWASGMMAQNIAERRAEAKRETLAIIHPKAGHWLGGHGYFPTTQHNAGPMKPGGTPEADAQVRGQAWPAMIAFLKKHLGM